MALNETIDRYQQVSKELDETRNEYIKKLEEEVKLLLEGIAARDKHIDYLNETIEKYKKVAESLVEQTNRAIKIAEHNIKI